MEIEDIEVIYPLTPVREAIFREEIQQQPSAAMGDCLEGTLLGNIDLERLETAWIKASESHRILRSFFVWKRVENPMQLVCKGINARLESEDLRNLTSEEQKQRRKQARETYFDLARVPLIGLRCDRLAEAVFHLVCTYHPSIVDEWSVRLLIEDLLAIYADLMGEPIPPLKVDRCEDKFRLWLERQDGRQISDRWRQELAGVTEATTLPGRIGSISTNGDRCWGTQSSSLSVAATRKLEKLLYDRQLSWETFCQGCWAVLLGRYSDRDEVLFGRKSRGRPPSCAGIESVLGCLENVVPMRVKLPLEASVWSWLFDLEKRKADLADYDHCSLLQMRQWSDIPLDVPMVESCVSFADSFRDEIATPSGSIRLQDIRVFSRPRLAIAMQGRLGASLTFELVYDRSSYSDAAIAGMVTSLAAIAENLVAAPESNLGELSLIDQQQRQPILLDGNDSGKPELERTCLEAILDQIAATPETVALVFGEQTWTYRELNEKANCLARILRQRGVKSEVAVGLCLERSPDLVCAMLAIWKAGGCYIPLDPDYPRSRLELMLEIGKPALVLTHSQTQLDSGMALKTGCQYLAIDRLAEELASQSPEDLELNARLDGLAHIIFTSGSTGRPKGIGISHRALASHMQWFIAEFQLSKRDIVLLKTPFSFDISAWELWSTLMVGGKLVLAVPGGHRDASYLVRTIREQGVTRLVVVPSLLQILLLEPELKQCESCQTVWTAGEALKQQLWEEFRPLGIELVNLYGPSETTVAVTFHRCQKGEITPTIPIGTPVSGTQLYILDRALAPTPMGIPGELYIGGVQLARGYCNAPALSAASFIPDPFAQIPGSRLYRTGDRVRYLPDGSIEFLGRLDHQVKLRGVRIELAEIEAALSQHPAVRETVVLLREDDPSNPVLTAYLILSPKNQSISQEELRQFLQPKLPQFMVPGSFVVLENFPLTPNGKLDRRALPAPQEVSRTQEQIPPRTRLEQTLIEIWQEILPTKSIGVTDNFFELGGHSLLGIRLIAAIEKRLRCSLSPIVLFREGTIEKIAAQLESDCHSNANEFLVPLRSQGSRPPLFLIHQAGGYALSYRDLATALDSQQPVYGIQARGLDGKQPPIKTIEMMASTYLKALQEICPSGPYWLGGHSFGAWVAWEIAVRLTAMGKTVDHLFIIDAHPPQAETDGKIALDNEAALMVFAIGQIGNYFNKAIKLDEAELNSFDSEGRLNYVLDRLQREQILPSHAGGHLVRGLFEVYRTNVRASWNYQLQPLPTPVSLFQTRELSKRFPQDEMMGWQAFAKGSIQVYTIDGTHETAIRQPHVRTLAEAMEKIVQMKIF